MLDESDLCSIAHLGLSGIPTLPAFPLEHYRIIETLKEAFNIHPEVEDVDQGLFFSLEEGDARSVLAKRDIFEKVCASHSYAILKEGSLDDINYGPLGCTKALWILLKL
jgi:hypothetical protein